MRWQRHKTLAALGIAAAMLFATGRGARATEYFDNQRGSIAARVGSQNTFQHNGTNSFNWVQWRNELRFDLTYDIIPEGQSIGIINSLKGNLLWRGRYDAVYDLRESYRNRDYDRGDFEFPEGRTPRELFFDVGFNGPLSNLSLRVGKQQVVWGESDLFRSIDVVNPLDLRQSGFVGEDFADFRQPLWIVKGLYNLGDFGKALSGANLEMFWSPNSRPEANPSNLLIGETYKLHVTQSVPNEGLNANGFTRNMSLPFNQVRAPWEFLRVGAREHDSPAAVQVGGLEATGGGGLADFMYRIKNDVPPSELSWDAQMAGVRLLGTTYGNAFITLNYLFKRSDSASAAVPYTQLLDPSLPGTGANQPAAVTRGIEKALTPDLNGNGIPDGQDEQIRNCLTSTPPTEPAAGGALPQPKNAGEIMLDPRLAQVLTGGAPTFSGPWHGSVYSDPAHPELWVGVQPGTFGVPLAAATAATSGTGIANRIQTQHMPYKPVLPLRGFSALDGLSHASFCQDIPVFHPWTHIIGMTATYNDYDYTGLIFRMEQSFSTKEPAQFSTNSPQRLLMQKNNCPPNADGFPECTGAAGNIFNAAANTSDFESRAKRYIQVWRSMVGFDYLRSLNSDLGRRQSNRLLRSLLSDQWFFTFQFLDTYNSRSNFIDHSGSFTDRYQQFNPFFTVSGTGFFMSQTFRPTWAFAYDTNQQTPLVFLQGAYFLTPKLEMRLGEVLYLGSKGAQDNGGLNYYADRDTFYVRLTYFLA